MFLPLYLHILRATFINFNSLNDTSGTFESNTENKETHPRSQNISCEPTSFKNINYLQTFLDNIRKTISMSYRYELKTLVDNIERISTNPKHPINYPNVIRFCISHFKCIVSKGYTTNKTEIQLIEMFISQLQNQIEYKEVFFISIRRHLLVYLHCQKIINESKKHDYEITVNDELLKYMKGVINIENINLCKRIPSEDKVKYNFLSMFEKKTSIRKNQYKVTMNNYSLKLLIELISSNLYDKPKFKMDLNKELINCHLNRSKEQGTLFGDHNVEESSVIKDMKMQIQTNEGHPKKAVMEIIEQKLNYFESLTNERQILKFGLYRELLKIILKKLQETIADTSDFKLLEFINKFTSFIEGSLALYTTEDIYKEKIKLILNKLTNLINLDSLNNIPCTSKSAKMNTSCNTTFEHDIDMLSNITLESEILPELNLELNIEEFLAPGETTCLEEIDNNDILGFIDEIYTITPNKLSVLHKYKGKQYGYIGKNNSKDTNILTGKDSNMINQPESRVNEFSFDNEAQLFEDLINMENELGMSSFRDPMTSKVEDIYIELLELDENIKGGIFTTIGCSEMISQTNTLPPNNSNMYDEHDVLKKYRYKTIETLEIPYNLINNDSEYAFLHDLKNFEFLEEIKRIIFEVYEILDNDCFKRLVMILSDISPDIYNLDDEMTVFYEGFITDTRETFNINYISLLESFVFQLNNNEYIIKNQEYIINKLFYDKFLIMVTDQISLIQKNEQEDNSLFLEKLLDEMKNYVHDRISHKHLKNEDILHTGQDYSSNDVTKQCITRSKYLNRITMEHYRLKQLYDVEYFVATFKYPSFEFKTNSFNYFIELGEFDYILTLRIKSMDYAKRLIQFFQSEKLTSTDPLVLHYMSFKKKLNTQRNKNFQPNDKQRTICQIQSDHENSSTEVPIPIKKRKKNDLNFNPNSFDRTKNPDFIYIINILEHKAKNKNIYKDIEFLYFCIKYIENFMVIYTQLGLPIMYFSLNQIFYFFDGIIVPIKEMINHLGYYNKEWILINNFCQIFNCVFYLKDFSINPLKDFEQELTTNIFDNEDIFSKYAPDKILIHDNRFNISYRALYEDDANEAQEGDIKVYLNQIEEKIKAKNKWITTLIDSFKKRGRLSIDKFYQKLLSYSKALLNDFEKLLNNDENMITDWSDLKIISTFQHLDYFMIFMDITLRKNLLTFINNHLKRSLITFNRKICLQFSIINDDSTDEINELLAKRLKFLRAYNKTLDFLIYIINQHNICLNILFGHISS